MTACAYATRPRKARSSSHRCFRGSRAHPVKGGDGFAVIRTRRNHKVVFQCLSVPIEDAIDARVQSRINDAPIIRNMGAPVYRVVTQKVVALAGLKRIPARNGWRSPCEFDFEPAGLFAPQLHQDFSWFESHRNTRQPCGHGYRSGYLLAGRRLKNDRHTLFDHAHRCAAMVRSCVRREAEQTKTGGNNP